MVSGHYGDERNSPNSLHLIYNLAGFIKGLNRYECLYVFGPVDKDYTLLLYTVRPT